MAVQPLMEESHGTYRKLFVSLKARGLKAPSEVVSDAHACIRKAVSTGFLDTSWQRCIVNLMRNILCHIPFPKRRNM